MLAQWTESVSRLVWGPGMLALLMGTGVFLALRLRLLPWRNLGFGLKTSLGRGGGAESGAKGDISPFASLCTTLAATIGTGNIAGVASALVAGGPGALVWMWVSAALGITTQFAECALAVRYRVATPRGEMLGGPMVTMERGLRPRALGRKLGVLYAGAAVLASFGIGNLTQGNSMADALHTVCGMPPWLAGIAAGIAVLLVISGGLGAIARVSSRLVPAMAVLYLAGGVAVIAVNAQRLPGAAAEMFRLAFSFRAAGGGAAGVLTSSAMQAMRIGMARGFSSNEAGTGSSGIAAAAAHTDSPIRQGYVNMTGTFWDTFVICSVTGLAILTSGAMETVRDAGGHVVLQGSALTIAAFSSALGDAGGWLVSASLVLFAFSTLLGWEYNGEKALEYLTSSPRAARRYRLAFALCAFLGCVANFDVVWNLSDILNALMLLPNTACLCLLSAPLARDALAFQRKLRAGKHRETAQNAPRFSRQYAQLRIEK